MCLILTREHTLSKLKQKSWNSIYRLLNWIRQQPQITFKFITKIKKVIAQHKMSQNSYWLLLILILIYFSSLLISMIIPSSLLVTIKFSSTFESSFRQIFALLLLISIPRPNIWLVWVIFFYHLLPLLFFIFIGYYAATSYTCAKHN